MRTLELTAGFLIAILYVAVSIIAWCMICIGKGGYFIREQSLRIWR